MEKSTIKAAAIKALMAANPYYHALPAQQQQLFRATMTEEARDRIDTVLFQELFGLRCTADQTDEAFDALSSTERNDFNWAKLLTTGIGDDMIWLNEYMAEKSNLLDFETFYDYDFNDYLFQEASREKRSTDYQRRDYYPVRFSLWARLIINDQFYYATLYSAASYLTESLEDIGDELIESLIPYDLVEGPDHGKSGERGFIWDMKIKANGLENQLEQLKKCWYDYIQQRRIALGQDFKKAAPAAYIKDKSTDQENHQNFIFNNEHALRHIRWQHFLTDCTAIQSDFSFIANREEQELTAAKNWLQQTYQDIMENFDPNVVTLQKKRQIIVAPGAFDALFGDDPE